MKSHTQKQLEPELKRIFGNANKWMDKTWSYKDAEAGKLHNKLVLDEVLEKLKINNG